MAPIVEVFYIQVPMGKRPWQILTKEIRPYLPIRILKIKVDKNNGKVYFATDKGIVAYNSKVAPFGESLGAVYAYPNPALAKSRNSYH